MKIEKKLIEELVKYLDEYKLSEIEYGDSNLKIKVSKKNKNQAVITEPKKIEKNIQIKDSGGIKIKSPIIGTAYTAPEPGAKKFIEVGKKIKKGDTIMIVEAMKTMNHVPSPSDGVVKEINIEDGQPVEYGQVLASLE